jgi:transposase-like protein
MDVLKRMPTYDAMKRLFESEDEAISFLFQHSAFYKERVCPECEERMTLNMEKRTFRCSKDTCHQKVSLLKNSLFYRHRIPCCKILQMVYFWLCGMKTSAVVTLTGLSKGTVASYYDIFRDLVAALLDDEDYQIGGEGVVVEIDETKMGKRKYNRGHRVEGVWIVGGVERTPERRVFLVAVENRNAETMRDVITRHVREGSIIHTDMWRGYNWINDVGGYQHQTVNHSAHFRDPQTGVHTNTIEGTWNGLKLNCPIRNRVEGRVEKHLFEFIWRRQQKYNLWIGFINALKKVHYE